MNDTQKNHELLIFGIDLFDETIFNCLFYSVIGGLIFIVAITFYISYRYSITVLNQMWKKVFLYISLIVIPSNMMSIIDLIFVHLLFLVDPSSPLMEKCVHFLILSVFARIFDFLICAILFSKGFSLTYPNDKFSGSILRFSYVFLGYSIFFLILVAFQISIIAFIPTNHILFKLSFAVINTISFITRNSVYITILSRLRFFLLRYLHFVDQIPVKFTVSVNINDERSTNISMIEDQYLLMNDQLINERSKLETDFNNVFDNRYTHMENESDETYDVCENTETLNSYLENEESKNYDEY